MGNGWRGKNRYLDLRLLLTYLERIKVKFIRNWREYDQIEKRVSFWCASLPLYVE